MPNYGFAIDLRKCIGCHACTIACKAEHDIPIGVNRCWVKSVEKGTFPDARRFFFPVLCNQCEDAPCVRICPTSALFRRGDGIVDLNGATCIGCRACMQACPYDQLFIDPNTRTAEKCNFCANRVENELLPSCVIVCPTGCRIFGDMDDPSSAISEFARSNAVTVRKPEKGTVPKVFYAAAEDSAIRPEVAWRPLIYKEGEVLMRPLGAPAGDPPTAGDPRVDYDVPHQKPWGVDVPLYLLTKAIGTGALLVGASLWLAGFMESLTTVSAAVIAIAFAILTALVLVGDLDHPERFHLILVRPNWRSWLARGAFVLMAFGAAAALWLAFGWFDARDALALAAPVVIGLAVIATSYTAFLFAQGLGRDLWQAPLHAIELVAQSTICGAAALTCAAMITNASAEVYPALGLTLVGGLVAHLGILAIEHLTPSPTLHHELARRALTRGAYSRLYWLGAVCGGGLLPLAIALVAWSNPVWAVVAAGLAVAGTFAWQYVWTEAGQSVPNS